MIRGSFRLLSSGALESLSIRTAGYKSQYNIDNIYPNALKNVSTRANEKKTLSNSEDSFSGFIPPEELLVKYCKSGGPGGQHANKVNTKVQVSFHVESAKWIPNWVKPRLLEMEQNNINKDGHLMVMSDKTRKQILNQSDCLYKIRNMIHRAAVVPKEPSEEDRAMMAKRKERARREMLCEKREHSQKKHNRQTPSVHTV